MSDLVVRGGSALTPDGRVDADVVIEAGRISSLSSGDAASGVRVLDAAGLLVVPGFIDLQCNGALGIDLTAEPERLWETAAKLPRWGVTAWLPTIVTSPADVRDRALKTLAAPSGTVGATPLGLHFEGPFLNPERRGAHAPAHLRLPDQAAIAGWSREAGVALVTLAPELPGALDMVRALVDRDVVVSLGHSAATSAEALAGVAAGARSVTHLFNAMSPLHHREPGLAGVALTDDRLSVGVIADGFHVDPRMVDLAVRALGDRVVLVTDAVAALGVPPGEVRLGDVSSVFDGESVRLADGTLAGSVLPLDQAVRNLRTFTGGRAELDQAVRAVTAAPARLLGLEDERGALVPGAVGDLVLLDPDAEVVATVIGGVVVHDRRAGQE
jgi:N-acetylglucosamine-6-phosphate deacetylase